MASWWPLKAFRFAFGAGLEATGDDILNRIGCNDAYQETIRTSIFGLIRLNGTEKAAIG